MWLDTELSRRAEAKLEEGEEIGCEQVSINFSLPEYISANETKGLFVAPKAMVVKLDILAALASRAELTCAIDSFGRPNSYININNYYYHHYNDHCNGNNMLDCA